MIRHRVRAVRDWRDAILLGLADDPDLRDVHESVVRALALRLARDEHEPGPIFRGSLADLARMSDVPLSDVAITVDRLIETGEIRRLRWGLVPTTELINGEIVSIHHPDAPQED